MVLGAIVSVFTSSKESADDWDTGPNTLEEEMAEEHKQVPRNKLATAFVRRRCRSRGRIPGRVPALAAASRWTSSLG